MAASPWRRVSGEWRLDTPAGPIRLDAASANRDALLVLRRTAPPAFRLSLVMTVERIVGPARGGSPVPRAAAIIYPSYGPGRRGIGFLFDLAEGLIRPVGDEGIRDSEQGAASGGAPVALGASISSPILVEILTTRERHELLARPGIAGERVNACGGAPPRDGARLVIERPNETESRGGAAVSRRAGSAGHVALAGRGCTVVFERIRVEPLDL